MKPEPKEPQPSKTQRKKEMHALQALGEQLVALAPEQLAELALPERLADAIVEAKRIAGFEARRRQMQFIGRLMRDVDAAPIAERIAGLTSAARAANAHHRQAEDWRERLLADEGAVTELARAHAGLDLQQLRVLIRNARKEQAQGRPPHAARALFRMLRSVLSQSAPPHPPASPAK